MSRPPSRGSVGRPAQSRSRSSSRPSSYSPGAISGPNTPSAPDPEDFCNSFWGDNGYHALLDRVKASNRMLEDLRVWYKERAAVEEDYAKKLTRLAKAPWLGGGFEVGGLRGALETVRVATAQSAHSHAELAGTIKTALEGKVTEFTARRDGLRKNPQALIERLFKKKSELTDVTEKARRKYEADAIAVNGFTAQTHLVQGRDLDRVSNKLDKARDSVQMNEKDYRSCLKNVKDTTAEWNLQWKTFCDLAQDLEEDRIDFVRTSFWDYANGVSTICVVDDEQCEKVRTSLEKCHTARDMKSFVRQAGTGSEIWEAPDYINYAKGEQPPTRQLFTHANFVRSSTRNPRAVTETTSIQDLAQAIRSGPPSPLPDQERSPAPTVRQSKVNTKRGGAIADMVAANAYTPGVANGRNLEAPPGSGGGAPKRASSPAEAMMNAIGRSPSPAPSNASASLSSRAGDRNSIAVPPSVGGAYVPPRGSNGPANFTAPTSLDTGGPLPAQPTAPASSRPNRYSGYTHSPYLGAEHAGQPASGLARAASKRSETGGSIGRSGPVANRGPQPGLPPPVPDAAEKPAALSRAASPAPSALSPPSLPGQDGSVDPLVAALEKLRSTPSLGSVRSPRSPGPGITAFGQRAKSPAPGPSQQQVPRRSTTTDLRNHQSQQAAPQNQEPGGSQRNNNTAPGPVAGEPYRRATSPMPTNQPADRSASPQPPQPVYNQRPQAMQAVPGAQPVYRHQQTRSQSIYGSSAAPPREEGPQPTGSPLGLDRGTGSTRGARLGQMMNPSGGTAAARAPSPGPNAASIHHQQSQPQPVQQTQYVPPRQPSPAPRAQQPVQQQVQQPVQQHPPPPQQPQPMQYQHQPPHQPPMQHPHYGGYGQPGPPQPQYQQPPQMQQPPPLQPQYTQQYQQPPYAQQPQANYYQPQQNQPVGNGMPRSRSTMQGGYHQYGQQQQQPPRAPSPQPQPPSLQQRPPNGVTSPTGNFTDSGKAILFYVRALYDYAATTAEDLSFQADDIIAITATDPDGWWHGELLDERRRRQGGSILPSNFVDLLS